MRKLTIVTFTILAGCTRAAIPTPAATPAGSASSLAELTTGFDARVQADVAKLRAATNAFHDPAAAQAAGYPVAPKCVDDSTMGGMGHHYFDRKIYDDTLDIVHPEMIIYAPAPGRKDETRRRRVRRPVSPPTVDRPRRRDCSARSSSGTRNSSIGISTSGRGRKIPPVYSRTGIRS